MKKYVFSLLTMIILCAIVFSGCNKKGDENLNLQRQTPLNTTVFEDTNTEGLEAANDLDDTNTDTLVGAINADEASGYQSRVEYADNGAFAINLSGLPNINTLEELMNWYLPERSSYVPSEDIFFVSAYRVVDTLELPEGSAKIYVSALCECVDINGKMLYGGMYDLEILAKKLNGANVYDSMLSYEASPEYALVSDMPQKVKDAFTDMYYYTELRMELDEKIADYLKSLTI